MSDDLDGIIEAFHAALDEYDESTCNMRSNGVVDGYAEDIVPALLAAGWAPPSRTTALRADLAAARDRIAALEAVTTAARKVVADWSDSDLDDNSDHPLWNRLDALAAAVRAEVEG